MSGQKIVNMYVAHVNDIQKKNLYVITLLVYFLAEMSWDEALSTARGHIMLYMYISK